MVEETSHSSLLARRSVPIFGGLWGKPRQHHGLSASNFKWINLMGSASKLCQPGIHPLPSHTLPVGLRSGHSSFIGLGIQESFLLLGLHVVTSR